MTPARGGLIDLLLPDQRDRRAIDETLADWREERAQGTGAGRLMADARGLLACARVLAGCIAAPCVRPDIWRYFGVTLLMGVAIGVALAIEPWIQWRRSSAVMPLSVWLTLVPGAANVGMLLCAAAGFGLRPGRRLPVATAAVVGGAVVLLLAGWVVPAANQQIRDLTAARANLGYSPPPGPPEMALPALISRLNSASFGERVPARRELAARIAFVGLCVALVAFGEAVRQRLANRYRWWIARAAAMVSGVTLVWLVLEGAPPLIAALPPETAFYAYQFHVDRLAAVPVIFCLTWWLARTST